MAYAKHVSRKQTPQSRKIPGKKQVENNAGGFVFEVDDWTRLNRFLILGSEGGSYYVGERKLTLDNTECLVRLLENSGKEAVNTIVEISQSGRAPKNDPAIFALAVATSVPNAAPHALNSLHLVCRTGTHLFQFLEEVQHLRGWGRALKRAVSNWYTKKQPDNLAYQLVKYQQRNGWSHRDALRLASPRLDKTLFKNKKDYDSMKAILRWVVDKDNFGPREVERHSHKGYTAKYGRVDQTLLPLTILGLQEAMSKPDATPREAVRIIEDYKLPREAIPTQWQNHKEVWEALLEDMPLTAMIRNLGNMTKNGLLQVGSSATSKVIKKLQDTDYLKKSRVHPVTILMALKTYNQGRGFLGKGSWVTVPKIVEALDDAFYASFKYVEPTGKRWMIGVDVSGSMCSPVANSGMTCCEGATAMALVTAHTEEDYYLGRFNTGFQQLNFNKKTSLDSALRYTSSINGGGTDCALPMTFALKNKLKIDVFSVITDSETWFGSIHPIQALQEYRNKMGIPAKLIVTAMVSNNFSIADPDDAGMMDVVGFDSSVPEIMSNFAR